MAAKEQLEALQVRLSDALLRKEQVTGELETLNTQIRAIRNVLEGVQLGNEVLREEVAARAKAAAESAASAAPPAEAAAQT
jgi:chromosome segregation ATPase